MKNMIKLQTDSIFQVPFNSYPHDFTFIVNGTEFQTNKIVSDILSPKISKIHQIDPTFSTYIIDTKSNGDFQILFDLLTDKTKDLPESNISFIAEVIEDFEAENIEVTIPDIEINLENVITMIKKHEKLPIMHKKNLVNEVDFLSEHFYELRQDQITELCNLHEESIENIINNDKLTLDTEDQLLKFIFKLCLKNSKFSKFYENVYFKNLSNEMILEFFNTFDINYLTNGTWNSLSKRFYENDDETNVTKRYRKQQNNQKFIEINYSNNNLKGIFNYLNSKSTIMNEVNVTCSNKSGGDEKILLDIENKKTTWYYSKDEQNSWFCFEFKNHSVIPSSYAIKSIDVFPNDRHPKSWIIEGSTDSINWIKIDEQINCSYLNGYSIVHNFQINKENYSEQKFNFIRIRQTGTNFHGDYFFYICSIEFYGKIFDKNI